MDTLRALEKSDDKTNSLCWKLLNADKQNMTLVQYLLPSAIDIQVFLHKNSIDRTTMVKPFLENQNIATLDKMVLTCLTKLLPTRIESPLLINYLIKRLKPNTLTTRETIVDSQMNMLKDIELIKQVKELANIENLTEELITKSVVFESTERIRNQIDLKIDEYMKQFMGEQRDCWLNRVNEINDERKRYRKLLKQALKSIITNRHTKAFCSLMNTKYWMINEKLEILLKHCFTYGNRFLKKTANILRRRWKQLNTIIYNKSLGIKIVEEEELLNLEEAKKDGSFWYPTIWNKIQQKKEWKLAFDKIPLNQQPMVMKLFVEDMPKLQYIQEIHKYLDNKMEEVYAKNINMLATTETEKQLDNEEEEFEEIDEEEARDLLASMDTQNLDPTDEPKELVNTNHEN